MVTDTHSEAGAYEFTTLTCIAGKINYLGAQIQLLDLPGIIDGAAQGKGRGKQVIAVARTADLVLMILDATKADNQKDRLERELHSIGIRFTSPPKVSFREKTAGGISITCRVKLTTLDEKMITAILSDYRIYNATMVIHEDIDIDQLLDVILGNRRYVKCLYCYNKIDSVSLEEVDRIARLPDCIVISCEMELNLDILIEKIWEKLDLMRIYTKQKSKYPDFSEGLVLRQGSTIKDVCNAIHKSLLGEMRYALVWGSSAKHFPQKVGLGHFVEDEDVVQIVK